MDRNERKKLAKVALKKLFGAIMLGVFFGMYILPFAMEHGWEAAALLVLGTIILTSWILIAVELLNSK